jgi:DNA segregation ATPase FtsK/SpoIIIE-like protein
VSAGAAAGPLLRALSRSDAAVLRDTVPWQFEGDVAAWMSGKALRLEAPWPAAWERRDVPLRGLSSKPAGPGTFVVGLSERGGTVAVRLGPSQPHALVAGATGSGKTWAMRSALAQLGADPSARFVLVDAKWGDGLGPLARSLRLAGPPAFDEEAAGRALSWAAREMRARYSEGRARQAPPLYVCVDEFQELAGDDACVESVRRLVAQGRGANVHVVLGTQHPSLEAFGDRSVRRNLGLRVALRVADRAASEVALGGPAPRADRLRGGGDAYAASGAVAHRVQCAYVSEAELAAALAAPFDGLEDWPGVARETVGPRRFTPVEVAVSLLAASAGRGRPWMESELTKAGAEPMGTGLARELLDLGRGAVAALESMGTFVVNAMETK